MYQGAPKPTSWVERKLRIQDKYDVDIATNGDNAQITILFPLEDLDENMGAVMDRANKLAGNFFATGYYGAGGGAYYSLFPGKEKGYYPVQITVAPSKLGGKTPEEFTEEFIKNMVV